MKLLKRPMKAMLNKYYKLENDNSHNECAILLTKQFGTEQELNVLMVIRENHIQRGYILQEEIDLRRNISQKYYEKLHEAVQLEKILTKK